MVDQVKYVAEARRVGGWWAIDVVGCRGAHTQARRLDQVESMARDIVALLTDAAPRTVEIEVRPILDPELRPVVQDTLKTRQALVDMEKRATAETQAASARLVASGLSFRDAGRLLGISHQRVAQLSASKPAEQPQRSAPSGDRAAAKRMAATGR